MNEKTMGAIPVSALERLEQSAVKLSLITFCLRHEELKAAPDAAEIHSIKSDLSRALREVSTNAAACALTGGIPEKAKASTPAGAEPKRVQRKEIHKGTAYGVLRLRCPKCGDVFGRFLREPSASVTCRCGGEVQLDNLTRYEFTCPCCDFEARGRTNLEDPEITVPCKCGNPVTMKWDRKPFFVRYFDWVLGCLHGDFGISYVNPKRTVAGELLRCLPATLQLAGTSFVIVAVLSIPIGFLCAVYKDGWFDKIMRGLVFVTTAMPAYWVGLLLMWGIGVKLNWLPTNGNGTWRHLILPSFTVALSYISTYIRLIRNNMLENMKQDYVLYANVRGLPQKSILVKHILKNSMHTCIVAMGMSIPQLISGTIVVENVFSWPGLGTLCISSIFNRDYPVIQTYVLLIGVLFVLFNLLFDILQTVSDPRLRKED